MEKSNQELSVELLEHAQDQLEARIEGKFTFTDFRKFVEKHVTELGRENEKSEKEAPQPSPQTRDSARAQWGSRRFLMFAALFCVIFGFFLLTIILLMRPEGRTTQLVGTHVRLVIKPIEKEDEPKVSRVVVEKAMGERLSEGTLQAGEEPIVSGFPGPSITTEGEKIGGKELFILGRKEDGEGPEEEGKSQVAMVEKAKVPAAPRRELPAGTYTVNIASFRDKRNADRLMRELEQKGYETFREKANIPQKGVMYRVAVGRFSSRREAQAFARGLKDRDGINSFVRKLKEAKQ
jgi:hypothetical protein